MAKKSTSNLTRNSNVVGKLNDSDVVTIEEAFRFAGLGEDIAAGSTAILEDSGWGDVTLGEVLESPGSHRRKLN